MKLLENTADIKKALGPVLDIIQEFSDPHSERQQIDMLRSAMLKKYPAYCASCGHYFKEDGGDAIVVYILAPIEGGAATEDNCVLLCKCCEELYNNGLASVTEMYHAAWNWRQDRFISLRSEMEKRERREIGDLYRPLKNDRFHAVHEAMQDNHPEKALQELRRLCEHELSPEDKAIAVILEARIQRRRGEEGSLKTAYLLLFSYRKEEIPSNRLPLFHYEKGYICQLLGLHAQSAAHYQQSVEAALALEDEYAPWEVFIARHRQYAVDTIQMRTGRVPEEQLKKRSAEFDKLTEEAAGFDQPYAGRWQYSILGWKWRYYLKCADHEQALEVYREWSAIRYRQNLTTGYTPDLTGQICGYDAMMNLGGQLSGEEVFRVLRSVSRSVLTLLKFSVRPRNIRDLLYTFEQALDNVRDQSLANQENIIRQIKEIRESILDGSSFLDPYRADSFGDVVSW